MKEAKKLSFSYSSIFSFSLVVMASQLIARRAMNPISIGRRSTYRRKIHMSTYDKNLDDQVLPTTVPDEVIQLQSDKYWGPHPKTGIFGPAVNGTEGCGSHFSLHDNGGNYNGSGGSVLDQTVWFRSIEGVDKPDYS